VTSESPYWTKSSYSDNGGNCVEVAANLATSHGIVPVRDSKRTDGPVITLTTVTFSAFLTDVRAGGFHSEGTSL
jgi:hypothetical protein